MISLNIHKDVCPCKSGKLIKDCACLTPDDQLIPQPCDTRVKEADDGGYGHPKCYAAALGNCSRKISKEHPISRSVLDILNQNHDLQVSGFPWQSGGGYTNIYPNDLASHILCEAHNSALSPLDALMMKFFNKFIEFNEEFARSYRKKGVCLFNGHDIERGFLKMLCGSLAAKYSIHSSKDWRPPREWLRILFDTERLPKNCGLYYINPVGSLINFKPGISLASLSNGVEVHGLLVSYHGHSFILATSSPPKNKAGTLLCNSTYRPKEFHFYDENNGVEKLIMLGWHDKGENKSIEIAYKGKTPPIEI